MRWLQSESSQFVWSRHLIFYLNRLSLIPLITKPTRTAGPVYTLMDNILASFSCEFLSGIISSDIADHLPVFFITSIFLQKKLPNGNGWSSMISFRVINVQFIASLRSDLMNYNFDDITNNSYPDKTIKDFTEILYQTYYCWKLCPETYYCWKFCPERKNEIHGSLISF